MSLAWNEVLWAGAFLWSSQIYIFLKFFLGIGILKDYFVIKELFLLRFFIEKLYSKALWKLWHKSLKKSRFTGHH